ncbi:MAG: hypothetical protein MRZ79_21615 [Bacteroidia bacterium]|nr:hypothetical protein [Bacteroidia bacterium]
MRRISTNQTINFLYFIVIICFFGFAQASQGQTLKAEFVPLLGGVGIQADTYYKVPDTDDSLTIKNLSFYISNLRLFKNGEPVFILNKTHHLIQLSNSKSLTICLDVGEVEFNEFSFLLGVDSSTQVSGVFGGDLDPMNGMYWGWQGGYINFKIEGNSSLCKSRKARFSYHIGGYQAPFSSLRHISLPVKDKSELLIGIDLSKLIDPGLLSNKPHLMSLGDEMVEFANKFPAMFYSIETE